MGCAGSKDDAMEKELQKRFGKRFSFKRDTVSAKRKTSAYLGIAMMQANRAATTMVGQQCTEQLDHALAQTLIRKAKNDGCTVSVVNGCLYVDYKFVGFLPPDVMA